MDEESREELENRIGYEELEKRIAGKKRREECVEMFGGKAADLRGVGWITQAEAFESLEPTMMESSKDFEELKRLVDTATLDTELKEVISNFKSNLRDRMGSIAPHISSTTHKFSVDEVSTLFDFYDFHKNMDAKIMDIAEDKNFQPGELENIVGLLDVQAVGKIKELAIRVEMENRDKILVMIEILLNKHEGWMDRFTGNHKAENSNVGLNEPVVHSGSPGIDFE